MTRAMLLERGSRRRDADLPKQMLAAVVAGSTVGVFVVAIVGDTSLIALSAGLLGGLLAALGVTDFLAGRVTSGQR